LGVYFQFVDRDLFIMLTEIMPMLSLWLKRGCAYSVLEKVSRLKSHPRAFSLVEAAFLRQKFGKQYHPCITMLNHSWMHSSVIPCRHVYSRWRVN